MNIDNLFLFLEFRLKKKLNGNVIYLNKNIAKFHLTKTFTLFPFMILIKFFIKNCTPINDYVIINLI